MSRYCGTDNSEPILRAAAEWRERALIGAGSVFSTEQLWNTPTIESLRRHFIDAAGEGEGGFLDKLTIQLSPAEPQVKRLASEMLWLLFLCPNNINPETKKEQITTVWEWSGRPLLESDALSTPVLEGIGSGGPGFHFLRWKELAFLIEVMLAFRALDDGQKQDLLTNGSAMSEWLAKQPEGEARQFRHMLLYLLFPDEFERIFSLSDKRAVIQAFDELSPEAVQKIEVARVDQELFKIRKDLENKYKTRELDFYSPPLVTQWGASPSFATSTKDIEREHILEAISEIDREGIPTDARSTTYDLIHGAKRYPPKYVLSLAAKHATGTVYDRELFSGGEKSQAFALLRAKGFAIERKDFTVNLLKKFLQQADTADDLSTKDYPKSYRGLRVSVSFGKGNVARIPWISFLGPEQETANGIYPVYLYYREAGLLILAYGISETSKPMRIWDLPADAMTVQARLVETGSKAERYGDSYVFSSYPANQLDPTQITSDLDRLVERYLVQLSSGERAAEPPDVAVTNAPPSIEPAPEPYTLEEATKDLFVDPEQFKKIIDLWNRKKNLILSGPPGVGKTFFSRRLAYALFKEKAPERVGAVQFHQSYSYEDFVQGYRPSRDGFSRKNGLFYDFCEQARDDNGRRYVFIIDEVNRGNVSKIFGELLMLVEADKRSSEWEIPLAYSQTHEETFHVPNNVYIVGLMNSADRSLAVVDYALRRRFAFVQLTPAYGSPRFRSFLKDRGASTSLIEEIIDNMGALNDFIAKDTANLGPGFVIGHSFFCDVPKEGVPDREWYEAVIDTEIAPLLDEYWFDKPDEVRKWVSRLKGI
jgi:5-methylcytosine-specific restriction protein B